jgi:hypothetical protein
MVAKEVPMPLRDHFRPPVSDRVSWEQIQGMWPARIVLQLRTLLPTGYVAGPRIHAAQVEIDVATFEHDDVPRLPSSAGAGGVATPPVVAT